MKKIEIKERLDNKFELILQIELPKSCMDVVVETEKDIIIRNYELGILIKDILGKYADCNIEFDEKSAEWKNEVHVKPKQGYSICSYDRSMFVYRKDIVSRFYVD